MRVNGGKTKSRNESVCCETQVSAAAGHYLSVNSPEFEHIWYDPKDGELCLSEGEVSGNSDGGS